MPSTNKTPNLQLNNWVGTDKPMRDDFNKDNLKIDDWAGSMSAIVGNPATIARLSTIGATNWDSGNLPIESGVWTPSLRGTTTHGSIVQSYTNGKYLKIGNYVTLWAMINATGIESASGALQIVGIPFIPKDVDTFGIISPLILSDTSIYEITPCLGAGRGDIVFAIRAQTFSGYLVTTQIKPEIQYVRVQINYFT